MEDLGLSSGDFSKAAIRKRFLELALLLHPDKLQNGSLGRDIPQKLMEISDKNERFNELLNIYKRAMNQEVRATPTESAFEIIIDRNTGVMLVPNSDTHTRVAVSVFVVDEENSVAAILCRCGFESFFEYSGNGSSSKLSLLVNCGGCSMRYRVTLV